MFRHPRRLLMVIALLLTAFLAEQSRCQDVPAHRIELYRAWKQLHEPPITPYHGPFGTEARAFVGDIKSISKTHPDIAKGFWDWKRDLNVYDPDKDPRPINLEHEQACIEDWRRMGYNCSYKGNVWTYRSGRYLKKIGMLGAIDQTLFGNNGPPPLQFDGIKEGRRQREACGSFFHPDNFQAGVDLLANFAKHSGELDMFKVGDTYITCSWDEVGMRTRANMDYRDPMRDEFRNFLSKIWFKDDSPAEDSNGDGRTYNQFTGENHKTWSDVEPVHVSLDWTQPAWKNDGTRDFSAMPKVDSIMFQQPARYKLLVDFHRYFTFEFFRRINDAASEKLNAAGTPGRVTCYPFTQHFIIWPGANQRNGNSFYWYHRLSPVVNVEHCWPESPVMNLNYAITDRLAPRYKNAVMGWVWFYFGQQGWDMYNGRHDLDRAMARMMGHTLDGTHHWLYSPRYRGRDQKQRLQIAYWQNFLKEHYASYLSKSKPIKPQVALLMPDTTGYFYRYFQYPKQDFAWTADALQQSQYPYHLLTEEELELGETNLSDYKVLYVVASEWSTPTIRKKIADYIQQGGVVFANVDSLTLDITTGRRIDFLDQHFGVQLQHKYKNAFYPSTQSVAEAVWALPFGRWRSDTKLQGHMVHKLDDPRAWAKLYARTEEKFLLDDDGKPKRPIPTSNGMAGGEPVRDPSYKLLRDEKGKLVRDKAVWKKLDDAMANMPAEVLGIKQSPIDMRDPPKINYAKKMTLHKNVTTWSEVDVAKPVGKGKPIAWWGDQNVGIETDQTVWLGTREGMSVHALSSRMAAHRGTEPCNPFPSKISTRYESFRPYVEAIGYTARKAGVTRPVSFSRNTRLSTNIEVLPRVAIDGTLMVVAINHDGTDAEYDVIMDKSLIKKLNQPEAWNILTEETIENSTDGNFELKVPAWGVAVFLVGDTQRLRPFKTAQSSLNKKDLSVPEYFLKHPHLNEAEWVTPVPPIEE